MRHPALILALLLGATAWARPDSNPAYDVARIAPGLHVDAPAVIRQETTTFEVLSRKKAEESHTVVYTIFRREGKDYGELELPYDRFREIDELEGALYDEHGQEIRELSKKDVVDESDISAYSLYEDARIRKATLYYDRYPYTVEFTYKIIHKGLLNYPSWYAQASDEPVEHARFEVILPTDQDLRFWINDSSLNPKVSIQDDRRHFLWEVNNLKELSSDDMEEDIEVRTASVRTAPQEFEVGGHPGSLKDWRSFGLWCAGLYQDKGQLPPGAARDVDSLVSGVSAPMEKARRLYRYLQAKTRYMNVTLGIGGWEPYDAAYVYTLGYGDCKALSSYMVSLLARAGVTAFPAVVYAGGLRSRTLENFPENRFNHVIVCVPLGRDSLWLECTSQLVPFGYLGAFTENRPALLIAPGGGILVRTPPSSSSQNVMQRNGRVVLTGAGHGSVKLTTRRTGNLSETVRGVMTYHNQLEKEQWVLRDLDVNGTSLRSYSVEGVAEHAGLVELSMNVDMPRFASSSGTRLFFMPDLSHRGGVAPKDLSIRKSPVRYAYPLTSIDSIRYIMPDGFRPEAVPPLVDLEASFGAYHSRTIAAGDTALLHVRSLEIRDAVIPADHYQEYVKFMKEVVKADKAQAVLVKKN